MFFAGSSFMLTRRQLQKYVVALPIRVSGRELTDVLVPTLVSAAAAILLIASNGTAAWAQSPLNNTATQSPETAADSKSGGSDTMRGDQRLVPRATSRPAALEYRASFAVIVGVNAYSQGGGLPPLEFAVNDARELRDMLRDEFGYLPERIRYLTDADAKLDAMRDSFSKWPQTVGIGPDDSLLVFFAGHGLVDPATKEGYLAAVDSDDRRLSKTCLSVEWIRERLAELPCRHKLVVLDSCYSGSLFQRPTATLGDVVAAQVIKPATTAALTPSATAPAVRGGGVAPLFSDNLLYYLRQPAFLGISAGRFTPVADGSGTERHSVFTASLLQVLRERADSPRDDHVFTFRQVASQVETLVANSIDSRQIPDWGRLGDGDGDFLFRPTKRRQTPREVSAARAALAKRRNYATALRGGFKAADENNMPLLAQQTREAERHLDGAPDFALRYLQRRFQDPRFVGTLGVDGAKSCAFSPSGRRFAALGVDTNSGGVRIKVWDSEGGLLLRPVEIHPDVSCDKVYFADDDRLLLRNNTSIVVWSVSAEQAVGRWSWDLPILHAEAKGNVLVVGGMRAIAVVDLATLRTRHTLIGHLGYIKLLAISPDGRLLASAASDDNILLWDLATGREIRRSAWSGVDSNADSRVGETEFIRFPFPQNVEKLGYLRFVSDDTLAVFPQFGQESEVWHLSTGKRHKRVDEVDGKLVATQIHAYSREFLFVQCGDFICARHLGVGVELPLLRLNLYHPQGESSVRKDGLAPSQGGWIDDLAVSPDGRLVAAATADGYLYDLKKSPPAKEIAGQVRQAGALAISPDGTLLVCGGNSGEVLFFEATDGKPAGKLVGHNGSIAHAVFSGDGKTLVTRSVLGLTGEVIVWDLPRRIEMFRIPDVGSWSSMPSISPDGRHLAVSRSVLGTRLDNDAVTYVYDLVQRKKIREFEGSSAALFSPEGQLLLRGDARESTRRIDGVTFRPLEDLPVCPLCFSDDGRYVAAFSRDEGMSVIEVRTWPDLEVKARLRPEDNENLFQSEVAFSRDGRLLATLRNLSGVELWDIDTGNLLHRWRGLYNPRNVSFGARDELLICASFDQGAWLYRALQGVNPRTEEDDIETLTKQLATNPADAAILMRRSGLHASRGSNRAAVVDLAKALELSTGSADDYLRLAELHRKIGNKEGALLAIGRYPAWADHDALRDLRFRLLDELGKFSDAERDLTLLLDRKPGDATLLVHRAETRLKTGRAKEALADLQIAAAKDLQTPRLLSVRASAKRAIKDVDGAMADCELALKRNPDDAEALFVRTECHSSRGNLEAVLADATRVLELDPDHVEARNRLAAYWHDKGKFQTALELCEQSLRRRPDSLGARYLKALTLVDLQEYVAAEKEYSSLLAINSKNAYFWCGRGKARMRQPEKQTEALSDFEEAVKLDSRQLEAYMLRADLQLTLGRLEQALADLGRAIELDPARTVLHFHRGKVLYKQGEFEAAEADFAKAFQAFPNDEDVVLWAARTLAQVGRYETALKQFDRLLDARPENIEYLRETAWWLATVDDSSLRNPTRAVELALRAVELTKRSDWESLRALAAANGAAGKFGVAYTELLAAKKLAPIEQHEQLDGYASQLVAQRPIVTAKPLPRLVQDIRHEDSKTSLAALSALGALGAEAAQAVPNLTAAFGDPKYPTRHSVAFALGRIGPPALAASDVLRRGLVDPTAIVRVFAAWALLKIDAEERDAVFVLVDQLRTEENLELVLELLADVGPRAAPGLSLYITFTTSDNLEVRKDALTAIGKLGPAGVKGASAIEVQLKHADEAVRLAAVQAALRVGVESVKISSALHSLLSAKTGEVRIVAAQVCRDDAKLSQTCPEELIALLDDQYHDIRAIAAEAIGKHLAEFDQAIPALVKAIDQPVRIEGRAASAEALARMGKKAIPAFRQLLSSRDGDTRFIAAGMLGNLKADAAPLADELASLALDETQSPKTREAALATLGLAGAAAESVCDRVLPLLRSPDERIRMKGVQAVGGMGRPDHPELLKMLYDDDNGVSEAASFALIRMGPRGMKPLLAVIADDKLAYDVRMSAAVRLRFFKTDWIHPLLETCATGDAATVELAAATFAFRKKEGDTAILPAMLVAASDTRPGVLRCAARTLYQLDAPLNEALPAILKFMRSDNKEIVGYAELTLEKFGESSLPVLSTLQQDTTDPQEQEIIGRALAAVYSKLQNEAVLKRLEK